LNKTLKISARNAGTVELEKYCPRCAWYLLRFRQMPFQVMPAVMFYMEQAQKAFILGHLSNSESLPEYFGPFAQCTDPVEFPFRMEKEHASGVILTAQVDMMLRLKNRELCLLDLKTSRPDGGGSVFRPQYEIQVIGYSWVTEATGTGKVGAAGLVYCDIQTDKFKADPLAYQTETGMLVPFDFKVHKVELEYSRLTRCLKEMKKLWEEPRPPQGADKCKDCALLMSLFDFEAGLRHKDGIIATWSSRHRNSVATQDYYREVIRGIANRDRDRGTPGFAIDSTSLDDGMCANWEFSS
jgi:hypothetical protein